MIRHALSLVLFAAAAAACPAAARLGPVPEGIRAREASTVPAGFVYVPGGPFLLGSDDPDADDDARPRRRAYVGSFYIGRCEVTQAEWKRFRPEFALLPGADRYPVTNVTREEAAAYCRFVGGRLPTEAEWEKAARGSEGRRYPWGDAFGPERANLRRPGARPPVACPVPGVRRGLKPVDAHPDGASPYGALQMAGNAWEWVTGAYQGDPSKHVIRGGAAGYGERSARTYHRAVEGAGVT